MQSLAIGRGHAAQRQTNQLCCRMPWTDEFWRPINLKDGRRIGGLAAARVLILSLPEPSQSHAHWQHAVEMLSRAAESKSAIDDAQAQMLRALKAEELI
jgi:hypothetical protein